MNDVLDIRPYQHADEPSVIALWQDVFPDAPPWNDPHADIRQKLTVQRDLFFVAEAAKILVGTAMAGFDGHRGWVYYVAVHPEHRRQGIGRALMHRVEQGLKDIGCTKLNLQVRASNETAVSFYRRLGYDVEQRVSMGRRLP